MRDVALKCLILNILLIKKRKVKKFVFFFHGKSTRKPRVKFNQWIGIFLLSVRLEALWLAWLCKPWLEVAVLRVGPYYSLYNKGLGMLEVDWFEVGGVSKGMEWGGVRIEEVFIVVREIRDLVHVCCIATSLGN